MWSKTEITRVCSFSSAFTRALTSLSSYSTQECIKRLSSLRNGVCYKRGVVLYPYYSKVGTGLSISCTQVSSLSLSSTPRESSRGCQVGPAGLGMWPRGHRLCRDALDPLRKSVAVVWLQAAVRGRPASPRPTGLDLTLAQARFALTH